MRRAIILLQLCAACLLGGAAPTADTSGDVAAIRQTLRPMEDQRLQELQAELKQKGVHIQGFYHMTKLMPHWVEVYQEQLRLLAGYHRDLNIPAGEKKPRGLMGLVEKLSIFEVTIKGKTPVRADLTTEGALRDLGLGFEDRVQYKSFPSIDRAMYMNYLRHNKTHELMEEHLRTGLTLGEYPTITALHDHCKAEVAAGRQSLVFYMHLKAANVVVNSDTVAKKATATAFWREAMNTLTLEYSSICLRALMAGSSICGSLYRHLPTSHFAGNFFWASCNHVAQLAPLPSPVTDFEAAEFFLMRTNDLPKKTPKFATKCAYEVLSATRRFYREAILPVEYISRLHELVEKRELPSCGISVTAKAPSFLCRGDLVFKNQPCLSVRTAPNPDLRNFYNVSFSNIETFRWT